MEQRVIYWWDNLSHRRLPSHVAIHFFSSTCFFYRTDLIWSSIKLGLQTVSRGHHHRATTTGPPPQGHNKNPKKAQISAERLRHPTNGYLHRELDCLYRAEKGSVYWMKLHEGWCTKVLLPFQLSTYVNWEYVNTQPLLATDEVMTA